MNLSMTKPATRNDGTLLLCDDVPWTTAVREKRTEKARGIPVSWPPHRCIHILDHILPSFAIPPRASLYTMRLQVHLTTPLSPGLDAPSLLQSPTGRLTKVATFPLAHALQSPPSNLAPPSRPSRRRAVRNCACLHGLLHTPTLQPHSRLQTI